MKEEWEKKFQTIKKSLDPNAFIVDFVVQPINKELTRI